MKNYYIQTLSCDTTQRSAFFFHSDNPKFSGLDFQEKNQRGFLENYKAPEPKH